MPTSAGADPAEHSARLFYGDGEYEIPSPIVVERGVGGERRWTTAELLSKAKFPVILAGGGVIMANGMDAAVKLAELLDAPVCNSYLHNDSFPAAHRLWCGPLGYQGSKAAMKLISKGRRGARARHPPRTVRHAAAAWSRLLAEKREDHPD